MIRTLAASALVGLLALGGPTCVGAQAFPAVGPSGPGATVPFVAQGPLLCGGASAAMLERFWGALGVYADDYAHLVDREAGGIRTGELARAVEARGHRVEVLRRDPAGALERVGRDVPVMVLLESGESRFHYVVVVGVGPDRIRFHDPLKGPSRSLSREDFLHRWSASDHWALVVLPPFPGSGEAARGNEDGPAAAPSEPVPPPLADAMEALRAQRPDTAAARILAFLDQDHADSAHHALAWEMLASARYLAGDDVGALAAWNEVGKPRVDLVQLQGLGVLPWGTVAGPMGVEAREVLRPEALRLARRRLLQLPAVRLGRVGYRPLRDGSVEVEGALLERRRSPLGPAELAGTALGALVNQRARMGFGPLLPVGERWRLEGSWEEARPRVQLAVDVPWIPISGVVTLRSGWSEERFADGAGGPSRLERRWSLATLRRWMTSGLRLGATAGVERWDEELRVGRLGVSALTTTAGDRLRLGAEVDGWRGGGEGAVRARVAGQAVHRPSARREWRMTLGGSLASGGSPPTVWDGAGTGRIRSPLLRGHPLERDGLIAGEALGRGLLHGTVGHAWILPLGPGRVAGELFLDGARVWNPLVGEGPRSWLDPGVELRLSDGDRVAAVSLARGAGEWVLSARVGSGTLPWLSAP